MFYTIQEISKLAGITSRTLRYYDEIGLLQPKRDQSSGYRTYSVEEVNKLQQILFFRELGLDLKNIMNILNDSNLSEIDVLKYHRSNLLKERQRLDKLIENVDKTLDNRIFGVIMMDKEKFEGFKRDLIKENEEKFGDEIREKYGTDEVAKSNAKMMNLSIEEYARLQELSEEIKKTLSLAFKDGNPQGALAQKAADLHKQWLSMMWENYSGEAHRNLAQMYVSDDRFRKYYDDEQEGTAQFLCEAINIYTKDKE